jgi:asparagine synthase (glutamine-hydrolysing)
VPLGALLSGGIDSNLVVAAMARQSPVPVKTYTAGFSASTTLTGTSDERIPAAEAAAAYGAVHESIDVDENIMDLPPRLIPALGEPFADSSALPTYLVCQAARRKVTVALTGDGGDEPFGGYSFRYLPHMLENRLRRAIPGAVLQPLAALLSTAWPGAPRLPRYLRLKTIFRNLAVSPLQAFLLDECIPPAVPNPLDEALLKGRETAQQLAADLFERSSGCDELTRVLYVDAKLYMAEDVLVKTDRMSMANSLELRAPLLDTRIVDFAFSLCAPLKIRNGECKYVLRRLARRRVPQSLVGRPKTGFSIPIEHYLRTKWSQQFVELVVEDSPIRDFVRQQRVRTLWQRFLSGDNRPLQLLWSMYVLALWFTCFHQQQKLRPFR